MSAARLALAAVGWGAGTWLLWRVSTCRAGSERGPELVRGGATAGATVVVPARNEEDNLPRLLASLAAQDPAPAEVVVVDDDSSDATGEVARRAGATVVTAGPLPPGWTGKAWACAVGAESAGARRAGRRGESLSGWPAEARPLSGAPGGSLSGWPAEADAMPASSRERPAGLPADPAATLVFLDADTWLAPGGLGRLLAEHRRRGGLVSVQPFHVTKRAYEALSAFFNVVSMMGVGAFAPRRRPTPTGAFGPCLVCSAADYATAGGHSHPEVRGRVVEDVALARRFTGTGLPVTVLGGRGTIAFRMYPEGLRQLVEGWTKNFATGASSTRPGTFLLISLWLSGCISAAWSLPAPAAAAVYVAYAGQLAWMLRRIGRFGWWPSLLYPVPLAFFLVVFARSLVLTHVRGEVRWRGRTISTRSDGSTRSSRR